MLTTEEILDRVIDRYEVDELVELLNLEEYMEDEWYDLTIEAFIVLFKKVILKNKSKLDIYE